MIYVTHNGIIEHCLWRLEGMVIGRVELYSFRSYMMLVSLAEMSVLVMASSKDECINVPST